MALLTVNEFLNNSLNGYDFSIEKLAGDASTRVYYRVKPTDGLWKKQSSLILMQMAEPDSLFVSVQEVLNQCNVPAPEIYLSDLENGFILLQDFGDRTLEQAVSTADENTWESLYTRSLDILIDIQTCATPQRIPESDCLCYSLAFDVEKLMYEMDFFIEHVLEIFKRVDFSLSQRAELRVELEKMCDLLSSQPRYLCHRDYHSRNLMVQDDGLIGVIDFQDARMGPLQYDLVSLLHDSYVDMSQDIRSKLYSYYLKKIQQATGQKLDKEYFKEIYNWMLVQRNLKAAGSFAYLDCVKKMDRYLMRLPQCLEHVKKAFGQLPQSERLRGLLTQYLPELK